MPTNDFPGKTRGLRYAVFRPPSPSFCIYMEPVRTSHTIFHRIRSLRNLARTIAGVRIPRNFYYRRIALVRSGCESPLPARIADLRNKDK